MTATTRPCRPVRSCSSSQPPARASTEVRVASLGIHTVVRTTFGLVFGLLAERVLCPVADPRPDSRVPAAAG
ncbi:hypothetical protein ACIBSV_23035 [Embleya sp. NPDC050154]|uniref:hypothetical protein n=1 Tax=Embleya sp. NPDC050154 TaxID=3363988 RepID=UPI0037B117F3